MPEGDTVRTFTIDDNHWLNVTGEADESKLLAALDGRKDDVNCMRIVEFMQQQRDAGTDIIHTNLIDARFIETKTMSKQTLFNNLRKLEEQGLITKPDKGQYRLAA